MTAPQDRGLVSRVNLWQAVYSLAQAWRSLPTFLRFASELPRNAGQRSSGIAGRLQRIQAGGGDISGFPLRRTRMVSRMTSSQSPFFSPNTEPHGWQEWVELSSRIELAHRITIAWLRSRLPGYPNLIAPQLAPGAPLTAVEADFRLTWARQEVSQGLQFAEPPAQIGVLLETSPSAERELSEATRILASALQGTEEWVVIESATSALTDSARTDLRRARQTISEKLANDEVDKYGSNLMSRYNYRVSALKEVTGSLSGPADQYTAAFEKANNLLEMTAGDVFGQLAAFGPPISLPTPTDVDLRPGTYQLVDFTFASDETDFPGFIDVGQIARIADPLIYDAVRLIGSTHSFSQVRSQERWTAEILSGTGDAWSHET